jgi:hypothetical protein
VMYDVYRGCLESPCEPCEALPLRAGHTIRRLAGEPTPHQPTPRQVDHRFAALGEVLIRLTQAAVPTQPGERAFPHPPAWPHREGRHGRRLDGDGIPAPAPWAFDALEGPAARFCHPRAQPLTPRGHVGPAVRQPRTDPVHGGQEPGGQVGISQVGGMDEDTPPETRRLHAEMACAAMAFLRALIAVGPPCSVVCTGCAARMAAEGCG